jgi:hypothetical protein
MTPKENLTEIDRVVETLRSIVGALNSCGLGSNSTLPVAIARLEERMGHLERTMTNMQKILIGLAASVLSLVIKMLVEGVFLK